MLWIVSPGCGPPLKECVIADNRSIPPANRARGRASRDLYIADLFAGAGGITEGFRRGGFKPVAAVEFDKWAARTYAANFGDHILACPIEDVAVQRVGDVLVWSGLDVEGKPTQFQSPEIDVLVGGPPCQGFSPLGRMNDWDFNDPRNKLWKHYVRILNVLQPKVFILENVPELLKSPEFQRLRSHVAKTYDLDFNVLNALHYGVPQARRRAIVIGSRVGKAALPVATTVRRTVRNAIGDLPMKPTGKDWHLPRNPTAVSIERYKAVPPGGNRFDLMRKRPDITPDCWKNKKTGSTDVFGRMIWDEAAPTIRTEFFKPEKGRYLHPVAHRPITIREAARLQTFPDGFVFVGSNVQVAKQIGNAVPVDLAERIAIQVRSMLAPDGMAVGIAGRGRNEAGPAQGKREKASLTIRSNRSTRAGHRTRLSKSEQMARVRSRDTLPEKVVRSALANAKVRFRLHRRDLPGTPDLYIARLRLAVFVHGCFWHGHDCPRGAPPSTNTEFWTLKLRRNTERDEAARSALRDRGISTLTIWACQLASVERIVAPLVEAYHGRQARAPVYTP